MLALYFLNSLRTNAAAIVTNQHTHRVASILNFDLDHGRSGMAQRIDHRFAADQEELFLDCRFYRSRLALYIDSRLCTLGGCDFVQKDRKGLLEIRCRR